MYWKSFNMIFIPLLNKKLKLCTKMDDLINEETTEQTVVEHASELARKKHRLLTEHIITQDEASKITDEEIIKQYNKLENKIIKGITKDTTTTASYVFAQLLQKCLPLANLEVVTPEKLQKTINENVFLQRYVNRIIPQLYFSGYSNYLLPVSLAISTIPHVQYKCSEPPTEKEFINLLENGKRSDTNGSTAEGENPQQSN